MTCQHLFIEYIRVSIACITLANCIISITYLLIANVEIKMFMLVVTNHISVFNGIRPVHGLNLYYTMNTLNIGKRSKNLEVAKWSRKNDKGGIDEEDHIVDVDEEALRNTTIVKNTT